MNRIAIVCGAGTLSGKEIMALELMQGLRAEGIQVEIATSCWGTEEFAGRARQVGVPVHRLWLGFISATLNLKCVYMTVAQLVRWPALLAGFRRFVREAGPQKVVHTNWHHLLLLWPLLTPHRDLFWVHEVIPNRPQYRCVFQFLSRRLQYFVAVSEAVARSLAALGIAPAQIRVVHNGLAIEDDSAARRLRNGRLRIGIVGQVGPWKGHEDMFTAMADLARSHAHVELLVFGRGSPEYEAHLKRLAASLGITDQVIWRGYVADRREIYGCLDICAVPSRSEDPLPTVAIEAALRGIPVVGTRRGGLPEIIREGETGFLVEAGQPSELAARIGSLCDDHSKRETMGVAAKRFATAQFGRARFVEDFLAVLDFHR